jgi:hypothetical protein
MNRWYCTVTPEVERRGLSDKQLVRYAKKELRKVEEFARAMFMEAVEDEKSRWWRYGISISFEKISLTMHRVFGVGAYDPLVYQRASSYKYEELLLHWYILLTNKMRPVPCSKV